MIKFFKIDNDSKRPRNIKNKYFILNIVPVLWRLQFYFWRHVLNDVLHHHHLLRQLPLNIFFIPNFLFIFRSDAVLYQVLSLLHEVPQDLHVGQRQGPGQPRPEPHHHHAPNQRGVQQDQQDQGVDWSWWHQSHQSCLNNSCWHLMRNNFASVDMYLVSYDKI